jgi:heme-degrading monooxygenase HmoA
MVLRKATREGAQVMSSVLINPFEVSSDTSDDAFVAGWERAAEYMKRQPGFLDAQLHRALRPDARYRFINVARWESPADFDAAVNRDEFRQMAADEPAGTPSLYEVVATAGNERETAVTRASEGAPDAGRASGPSTRPRDFVAAVLDDKRQLDQAVEQIVALGIDEPSLGVLYGPAGAEAIAQRHRHGFGEMFGDEDSYVHRYQEEIARGGFVLGVPVVRGPKQREQVRGTLRAHGAHFIVSRTRWDWTVED